MTHFAMTAVLAMAAASVACGGSQDRPANDATSGTSDTTGNTGNSDTTSMPATSSESGPANTMPGPDGPTLSPGAGQAPGGTSSPGTAGGS